MGPRRYDPRRSLLNWKIGNLLTVKKTETGVVNQNWLVGTTRGQYILRRVAFETSHELRFELNYLRYLRAHCFPYEIPSPVSTFTKQPFVRTNDSISWLYRRIEGDFKTKLEKKEILQVAKMMAIYHSLVEKSQLDNGKGKGDFFNKKPILNELRKFQAELSRKTVLNTADRIFLKETAELLPLLERLRIEGKVSSRLKRYPLHRDITPDNLVWRNGKLVGLIDFENVGRSNEPLIRDISVFFQHGCRENSDNLNLDLVRHFLHEYRKYHSLAEAEIKLIPSLIVSGFIEDFSYAYWMIRSDPKRAKLYRLRLYSRLAQSIGKRKLILTL